MQNDFNSDFLLSRKIKEFDSIISSLPLEVGRVEDF